MSKKKSTQPNVGWYADTNQPGTERYWDGSGWTDKTRPLGPPPPPPSVKSGKRDILGRSEADREKDRGFVKTVGGIILVLVVVTAFANVTSDVRTLAPPQAPVSADDQVPTELAMADESADVSFRVDVTDEIDNVKLSLDIFLEEKIDEPQLMQTANEVYAQHGGSGYERVFMTYILTGEDIADPLVLDDTAWATTHVNPEMEVHFLTSSLETENSNAQVLNQLVLPGEELGRWLIDTGVETHLALYRTEDGEVRAVSVYEDGSTRAQQALIVDTDLGLRIDLAETFQNDEDGHILLGEDSRLEYRDIHGPWFKSRSPGTATPAQLMPAAIPQSATTTTTEAPRVRQLPEDLTRAVVQEPSDEDWQHLSESISATCDAIGSTDAIAYTGFDDIWIRYNEQWLTFSWGIDFLPFAEIADETGVARPASDAPAWLRSDKSRLDVLFNCYEEVHSVNQFGDPTEIDVPNRVVPRGGDLIDSFQ